MRNTRCPDSKGIKTVGCVLRVGAQEIPDALIQKGLRPKSAVDKAVKSEIPDALIQKGLRPLAEVVPNHITRNTRCPDSKGIKTVAWQQGLQNP